MALDTVPQRVKGAKSRALVRSAAVPMVGTGARAATLVLRREGAERSKECYNVIPKADAVPYVLPSSPFAVSDRLRSNTLQVRRQQRVGKRETRGKVTAIQGFSSFLIKFYSLHSKLPLTLFDVSRTLPSALF